MLRLFGIFIVSSLILQVSGGIVSNFVAYKVGQNSKSSCNDQENIAFNQGRNKAEKYFCTRIVTVKCINKKSNTSFTKFDELCPEYFYDSSCNIRINSGHTYKPSIFIGIGILLYSYILYGYS